MPDRHTLVPAVAATLGTTGFGLFLLVQEPGRPPGQGPPRPVPPAMSPAHSAATSLGFTHRGQTWTVVASTSAVRMLIVEVEATRLGEAVAIAQQITEPVKARYDEVLVFFFEPGARPRLAARRVQWTRALGYRLLELTAES